MSNGSRAGGPRAGQVLPLFALMLVVLFGMLALAVDVTRAYADLRHYRSVADAASLAGAQDLQRPNSRAVNPGDYPVARGHALGSLVTQLGATSTPGASGTCNPTSDLIDCPLPGTPYLVSVKTPSPSCTSCDPTRSVQVTVRNPDYRLTFARVLGITDWNVGITSVSGLVYGSQYAVITLRPPKRLGSTFDVKDLSLTGGSVLTVRNGDIGSNANMELSGTASGTAVNLDSGYKVFHYDDPPMWIGNPPHQRITTLINDPNYVYPSFAGAPTYANATIPPARTSPDPLNTAFDPTCAAAAASIDRTRYTFMATKPLSDIYCYSPGIYDGSGPNPQIDVGTGKVGLLKPGAYYLKRGLQVRGRLIGGWEPNQTGVVLVFDECNNTSCIFDGNSAETIALNAGTAFPPGTAGTQATAARDWAGNLVQTSGPSSPTPPLMMTIMVRKDANCYVPTSPPFQEPAACDANHNKTLNMAGGGSLALAGVQYAPTDNASINGGSAGTGDVGQIISWTLTYTGGTHINQQYPGNTGNGVLRIDAACSAPGEPCSP